MTLTTVAPVLGLAVLDTLSPALLGITLFLVLTRPPRLGLLLGTFLLTLAGSYFALGVVLMLGLDALLPAISPEVAPWIQAGMGVALFIASWLIPTRPSAGPEKRVRALTVGGMIGLGVGAWLFEFATAVPYFAAIGIMTAADLEPAGWLVLLGAYVLIMILPGVGIYAASLALGERTHARFARWKDALESGSRSTLSWILGIAGVVIVLNALPQLGIL
ncbi:GAP family protein [Brevibacterium ihuae]|uniref:GAP family protein n=1 Tax=Brevibacterium ihuae TaxID=1631743 RepID=UPI000C76B29C|nr:GAP family protein [Brevibacterium ihuae]